MEFDGLVVGDGAGAHDAVFFFWLGSERKMTVSSSPTAY